MSLPLHLFARTGVYVGLIAAAFAAFASASVADTPASRPISSVEEARLQRGVQVRRALLNALEQAELNAGVWPEALPAAGKLGLVYSKPAKLDITWPAEMLAGTTVVIHEQLERNSGGVWVGYADGHLDFASSAQDLAACKDQLQIVRAAIANYGDPLTDKLGAPVADKGARGKPTDTLKIRILDQGGQPVGGAWVGLYARFGDRHTPDERVIFPSNVKDAPAISDGNGEATVPFVFDPEMSRFSDEPVAPLYILHEQRQLVALEEVRPQEFVAGKMREIRLQPGCKVIGTTTSLGLYEAGRSSARTTAIVYKPGQYVLRCLGSDSNRPQFEFILPPGDYGILAHGADTEHHHRFVHIEPGTGELKLQMDLLPSIIPGLVGHAAPELRGIKAWKNGAPVKLADLRGKLVVLDFWGYWCGVCKAEMPELMKLHDELKDKGVVIIAVHDDSADSIEDMDRKLEDTRKSFWNNRDLPFLIALDGGGTTRMPGRALTTRGATTAAYGVTAFPTTLLIGRDGKVVCQVRAKEARGEIEKLLKIQAPAPK